MKKIGRKRNATQVIANALIATVRKVWESDLLGRLLVYSYVILGFMLVLRVMVLGA